MKLQKPTCVRRGRLSTTCLSHSAPPEATLSSAGHASWLRRHYEGSEQPNDFIRIFPVIDDSSSCFYLAVDHQRITDLSDKKLFEIKSLSEIIEDISTCFQMFTVASNCFIFPTRVELIQVV